MVFWFSTFLRRFLQEATQRGMRLPDPASVEIIRSDINSLKETLLYAAEHGCRYALVIHSDKNDDMHSLFLIFRFFVNLFF